MRRFFRRMTVLLTGALVSLSVVLLALLLLVAPGVPAVAGPSAPVIEGSVSDGAEPVGGVQVGFWRTDGARVAITRTSGDGAFRLPVDAQAPGFLAVGSAPTSTSAVFAAGSRHLVRSVLGAGPAAPVAALTRPTTAGALADRGRLSVHLQRAGRLAGTSTRYAGTGDDRGEMHLLRANGSEVDVASADQAGAVATEWVAPGRYDLELFPRPPYLRRTLHGVRVEAGRTATVDLDPVVRGATASGTITVDGRPAVERIPARVLRDGVDVDAFRSDEHGRWSLPGLAPGDYTIRLGSAALDPDDDGDGPPPPPTADTALPRSVRLRIDDDRRDRTVDVDLRAAASATGRLTGVPGAQVLLESSTGRVLRIAAAADDRTFTFGGLVPGRDYRVVAPGGEPGGPLRYGMRTFTAAAAAAATAGATALGDLRIARHATELHGSVAGAAGGIVRAEAVGVGGRVLTARIGADGAYRMPGLVPGRWRVRAEVPGRLPGATTALTVASHPSVAVDPAIGAPAASFRAVFRTGTTGVRIDGAATDPAGDRFAVVGSDGRGTVRADGLRPGRYRFTGFDGTVPAQDGPWWFVPPAAPFTLRAGATTDLGRVALAVRAG